MYIGSNCHLFQGYRYKDIIQHSLPWLHVKFGSANRQRVVCCRSLLPSFPLLTHRPFALAPMSYRRIRVGPSLPMNHYLVMVAWTGEISELID
jgi:hypothetical protein